MEHDQTAIAGPLQCLQPVRLEPVAEGTAEALLFKFLFPEFITPQEGHTKQDGEIAAAKRWLAKNATPYAPLRAILLGDDIYSHQPFCRRTQLHGFDFIFVCKPQSHATLYNWATFLSLADQSYRLIRAALPTRKTFFADLRALTRYMLFPNWDTLMDFMLRGLEIGPYAKPP